jgi:hypothetical protein
MKGLATLVGEGISVPDTVFPDPKNVKDALQTTLKEVDGTLICLVFLFNLFSVLLSPIDIIHDVFELLASGLELPLRSVTNAVGSVSLDLLFNVADLLDQLFLLGIKLADIVV